MRPEADGLQHLADGPGLHEFARLDRGAVLEPLAVDDRVDALGLGLHRDDLGQLRERGDAGLVGDEVLAGAHHADAERRPLGGNGGTQHDLDRGVVEDLCSLRASLAGRMTLEERGGKVGLFRIDMHQFAAPAGSTAAVWL